MFLEVCKFQNATTHVKSDFLSPSSKLMTLFDRELVAAPTSSLMGPRPILYVKFDVYMYEAARGDACTTVISARSMTFGGLHWQISGV